MEMTGVYVSGNGRGWIHRPAAFSPYVLQRALIMPGFSLGGYLPWAWV